jgi:5-methylcytosine-specific restriction endonuclease McrA
MAYIRFGLYNIDEVLPFALPPWTTENYFLNYGPMIVDMRSVRYQVFNRSLVCVSCGTRGVYFALEQGQGTDKKDRAHFNLYALRDGKEVMMTKDHIIPRKLGGTEIMENLQTMCQPCNTRKGHNI